MSELGQTARDASPGSGLRDGHAGPAVAQARGDEEPDRAEPVARRAEPVEPPGDGEQEQFERADATPAPSLRNALQVLTSIVAPTTLITALLYYFGFTLVREQAILWGVDESTFGLSTQDYLVRSVEVLYLPLAVALLLGVLWLWLHALLLAWDERPDRRELARRLATALAGLGAALFAVGVFGAFIRPSSMSIIVPPLCFSLGIPLVAYGTFMRRRLPARGRKRPPSGPSWLRSLHATLICLLTALSLFWLLGVYAQATGRGLFNRVVRQRAAFPSVAVYTAKRLHIDGPGVRETELPGSDSAERFRYAGLRLLLRSNGRYFLLPDGWSPTGGTVIVLPDSDAFRFEFTRRVR